ncbi:UDP-glucuronosyltransferase 2B15 [Culex quinquefasciatus]|uniref:UDP-glucuronosyltransferase n=1 Tax=Culex quinquefasciatus TaxID=7176 RepID=B0XLE1_CULQU|nr:UDP-glucuronosyltransferase 2B15 [Culex quinquefasciatus]|eukprot:XP_001870463.1 UDP-glucuronosyltransferase 2B15 [Culex quinquefasciatus]
MDEPQSMRMKIIPQDDVASPFMTSQTTLLNDLAFSATKNCLAVTDVSPFKLPNAPTNYRHVELETDKELFNNMVNKLFNNHNVNPIQKMITLYTEVNYFSNSTLSSPNVQKLLHSGEKFDLLILEIFLDHALLGIADHFGCPVIGMTTHGVLDWINVLVGTPQPLSYVPHVHLGLTDRMNFWQRFGNVMFDVLDKALLAYYFHPVQEKLYREAFPNAGRSLDEMMKHSVSAVLVNSHFSISFPRPYVPNMIEIGGFHVNRKVNPLPENIRTFIEKSPNGVIYFSMGSNLKPSAMEARKRDALLNAFAKVNQSVIWKWNDDSLKLDPSKFLISDWLPQDDILAHPNVKLFVTHGGLLSCTESIHHGKPIVGIPIFGDQQLNMARVEQSGWGLRVNYVDLDEETFSNALTEVLGNAKYSQNVEAASRRLRDQPLPPMDMAKYWVNYVLRHDGAEHLRSPAQHLNFVQYNNLDVYGLVALVCALLIFAVKRLVQKLCSCFRSAPQTSQRGGKSKKKKN